MRYLISILTVIIFTGHAHGQSQSEGYIIKSIYFGGGSYYVDPYQAAELYQFLDSIPGIQGYTITIHSHTDNIGGVQYNEWLAGKRNDAVIQLLLQKKILYEMIERKDFGQLNPVFDNSSPIGRMRNRRVDIIFWPLVL